MEFFSNSAEETIKFASGFAEKISPQKAGATILGLYGDLGAGKTTFMKGLAKFFGVSETIQSPTFVIEKIYELEASSSKPQTFNHLIHIDAYRIEESHELVNLGWKEIISDTNNLICIEWPERIKDIMPEHHARIKFEHLEKENNENERKITIQ